MRISVAGDEKMAEVYFDGNLFNVYWRPSNGGYVREVTDKPGMSGQQVSETLEHTGDMWEMGADGDLTGALRRLVNRRQVREVIKDRIAAR